MRITFTRSNPVWADPRVERAARCLQGAGYNCLALAWARETGKKAAPLRTCLNVRRFYFPGRFGGGLANALGLLVFNGWLLYMHLKDRPQVIHAVDLDTVFAALAARLIIKNRVVYDIADWYADSRKVGRLKPLVSWLERLACRAADLVVLAHERRIKQIGFTPRRWIVFYNTPEDLHCLEDHGHTEPGDYFAYVGVLQPDRGIEHIIRAAVSAGAKLTIAGFGPLAKLCAQKSQKEELITFRGRVSYEEALTVQKGALAILAFYDPSISNNRFAAPNKLYEAMMLGRPIITSGGTLVGEIVERKGIGLVVPYGDVLSIRDALRFIMLHPEERQRMGQRGRKLYEEQYSFTRQCMVMQEAYRGLISQKQSEKNGRGF